MPSRRRQPEIERGLVAATLARHPREFVGLIMAAGATAAILVNALFMQHGPHPAPIFATRPFVAQHPAPVRALEKRGVVTPVALPEAKPKAIAAPHNDPIAALIAPSTHMLAVQRALSDFGYGQIRPSGVYDHDTRLAIEKFERDRGLPVDGQISDRFVRALSAMTGRPLQQ